MSEIIRRDVEAVVLGGGISGIAAAIRLRRDAGLCDVVLIEQSDHLGGTWTDNTYPGCACDVPANLYSFDFAPNPDWSRMFASQREILSYIQRVADDFGVTERTMFATEVTAARWHEESQRWLIDTTRGGLSAAVFIFAVGKLNEPLIPTVPGLSTFEGTHFHSARWDHDHDLSHRRVAVIGSGASAIQLVPQIQPDVVRLTYVQRTACWVWPKFDRPTSPLERTIYRRFPFTQRAARSGQLLFADGLVLFFLRARMAQWLNVIGQINLFFHVRDRELRRILTPTFTTGCKRVLSSNDYYPALTKSNVDVVPHALREVRSNSIVTDDGVEHRVDTIIWATGFHALDPPFLRKLIGRDGYSLAECWNGNPRAYMGASTSGFPNAFMMWGPNSGTGCNFITGEAQLNYVVAVVRALRQTGASSLDIRPEVVDAWKDEMSAAMARSTWIQGGCDSWYRDRVGDVHAVYGGTMRQFIRRGGDFDPAKFTAGPAQPVDITSQ